MEHKHHNALALILSISLSLSLSPSLSLSLYIYIHTHTHTHTPTHMYMNVCICMQSCFSCVWLTVTQWTVAHQSPLSTGSSGQEDWSELLCSPPGESSQPRDRTHDSCISCNLQVDSLSLVPPGKPMYMCTHTHTHTYSHQQVTVPEN